MRKSHRIAVWLLLASAVTCSAAEDPASTYKSNCAKCHGTAGDADTPAGKVLHVPSFSSIAVLKESDERLLAVAKRGKGSMPAWNDVLSEKELRNVIAFIHTLQKR
jgi:mono/diheme cytochrome c family protein